MMKINKMIVALISALVLLVSCENNDSKTLYHSYGLAYPIEGESYSFKLKTDQGETLIPNQNSYNINDTARVYCTFTLMNEDESELDSVEVDFKMMTEILYKPITTQDSALGNDPVYIRKNEIWQSEYNQLLNVKFAFDGGGETHLINLYLAPTTTLQGDTIALELRHNANADPYHVRMEGLISFDLSLLDQFVTPGDSIYYKVNMERSNTYTYLDHWVGVYKR